ncbi:MAG TPA: Rieske 2Fe-2S domain-containing protein [Candidatus Binatia bacterium]
MLTKEENSLLTQTGPGTLLGNVMRRYWQPVALLEELPPGGAPSSIRLLSENLVLFRDDEERIGLLGLHCSHRRADLSYGRVENGGLRCLYHGWLYDIQGNCLEQPGEPRGGESCKNIRHLSYPCREFGGLIFTYMGPGEPPRLPIFDALVLPESHRTHLKVLQESNYLQSLEGNLDPAHVSFLHRVIGKNEQKNRVNRFAVQSHSAEGDVPAVTDLFEEDVSPTIEFEGTDCGIRYVSLRNAGSGKRYIRGGSWFMPNFLAVPGSSAGDGYTLSWHVPIDDETSWRYTISCRRSGPMDPEGLLRQEHAAELGPDYRTIRNKSNRFLQDRAQMKTTHASGFGPSVAIQDVAITDSQEPIMDRTQERLGYTDRVIVATRLTMLKALNDFKAGRGTLHEKRDRVPNPVPLPVVVSALVSGSDDWKSYYRERIKEEKTIAARALGIGL